MAVHAGWQGTVDGIAEKAWKFMVETYRSKADQAKVFFGPSAKPCCYEVGNEFTTYLQSFQSPEKVLLKRDGKLFFDVSLFNSMTLERLGIKKDSICLDYNVCTMCNSSFASHRRQGLASKRQMTIACQIRGQV